jgi:hypothetical protein
MTNTHNNSTILIVEDDLDQMQLLVNFAHAQIKKLIDDERTNDAGRQLLMDIQILKVSNIASLEKAVSLHKDVLLAILDCNIPDKKGGVSHDQLVKTNHAITGQHKPVDIVSKHLPNTPITMISSLGRFQRIVANYYVNKHHLSIGFIRKNDTAQISENIADHLRDHLAESNEIKLAV